MKILKINKSEIIILDVLLTIITYLVILVISYSFIQLNINNTLFYLFSIYASYKYGLTLRNLYITFIGGNGSNVEIFLAFLLYILRTIRNIIAIYGLIQLIYILIK